MKIAPNPIQILRLKTCFSTFLHQVSHMLVISISQALQSRKQRWAGTLALCSQQTFVTSLIPKKSDTERDGSDIQFNHTHYLWNGICKLNETRKVNWHLFLSRWYFVQSEFKRLPFSMVSTRMKIPHDCISAQVVWVGRLFFQTYYYSFCHVLPHYSVW